MFFSLYFLLWSLYLTMCVCMCIYMCIYIYIYVHACRVALVCPTLCDSVDYSPPGFSVHGILQARILEWVALDLPYSYLGMGDHKYVFYMSVYMLKYLLRKGCIFRKQDVCNLLGFLFLGLVLNKKNFLNFIFSPLLLNMIAEFQLLSVKAIKYMISAHLRISFLLDILYCHGFETYISLL